VAQELSIPAENLISPEIIRRICWAPPADSLQNLNVDAVCEAMLNLGARQWQVEVVAPLVAAALLEREPREVPVVETAEPAAE
jgi:ribonuclease D